MIKSNLTPSKTFYKSSSSGFSSFQKGLSDEKLKKLELQALSLMDSDIITSKQIIEKCLRSLDEQKFPILENM